MWSNISSKIKVQLKDGDSYPICHITTFKQS